MRVIGQFSMMLAEMGVLFVLWRHTGLAMKGLILWAMLFLFGFMLNFIGATVEGILRQRAGQ